MVHCRPPLQLEELPKEDEERLEKLFSNKLDIDGNRKIDIHDLSAALKELAPHINRSYAEKSGLGGADISICRLGHCNRAQCTGLLKRMDQDGSLTISYEEWRDYLLLAAAIIDALNNLI